jgi:flagellar basal body-associated protein FliL
MPMTENTEKAPPPKNTPDGLELDRMNLSELLSNSDRKPSPQVDAKTPSPGDKAPNSKKVNILILVASLAVLALIMILTVLFKQQDFSFTFEDGQPVSTLESYLRIGPISATLADEDIINFSVEIDCKNRKLKEKLTKKDSQIRDRIVSVITTPGIEMMLKEQRYEEIKARIKESLDNISSEPVGDIYFADIIIY